MSSCCLDQWINAIANDANSNVKRDSKCLLPLVVVTKAKLHQWGIRTVICHDWHYATLPTLPNSFNTTNDLGPKQHSIDSVHNFPLTASVNKWQQQSHHGKAQSTNGCCLQHWSPDLTPKWLGLLILTIAGRRCTADHVRLRPPLKLQQCIFSYNFDIKSPLCLVWSSEGTCKCAQWPSNSVTPGTGHSRKSRKSSYYSRTRGEGLRLLWETRL